MSDTTKVFAELDKAEEIGAISMSCNGNIRSELLERDSKIVMLAERIKELIYERDLHKRSAEMYLIDRNIVKGSAKLLAAALNRLGTENERLRNVLNQIRTFPGTPQALAKLVNETLDGEK